MHCFSREAGVDVDNFPRLASIMFGDVPESSILHGALNFRCVAWVFVTEVINRIK
jgi:hypothetical protein